MNIGTVELRLVEVKSSRTYVSPVRAAAARATRLAVLSAAHDLFVAQGYGATTIDQVAIRAGVSKPTVFSAVGSKRELLKQVRDVAIAGDDEATPVAARPDALQVLDTHDATEVLRRYARFAARINSRYAEVNEVLVQAAGEDDDLKLLLRESEAQRRRGSEIILGDVVTKARLRHSRRRGVDVLWNLTAPELFLRLVRDSGWSPRSFETWLGVTMCELLLREHGPAQDG